MLDLVKLGNNGLVSNYLRRKWAEKHEGYDPVHMAILAHRDSAFLRSLGLAGLLALVCVSLFGSSSFELNFLRTVYATFFVGIVGWGMVLRYSYDALPRQFAKALEDFTNTGPCDPLTLAETSGKELNAAVESVLIVGAKTLLRLERRPAGREVIEAARARFSNLHSVCRALYLGEEEWHSYFAAAQAELDAEEKKEQSESETVAETSAPNSP